MRIENIAVQAVTPEQAGAGSISDVLFAANTKEPEDETRILKTVQAGKAGYSKNDFLGQGADSQEEIARALQQDMDAAGVRDVMCAFAEQLDENTIDEVEKSGFTLEAAKARQINTATDKIMANLAMAGVDVSKLGADFSKVQIESLAGVVPTATLQQALEIISEGGLNENGLAYLLKNELEPTIDNVYKAKFSGSAAQAELLPVSDADMESLGPEIEKVLAQAGLAADDESLENARWMLERGIELTPDNFEFLDKYGKEGLFDDVQAVAESIKLTVAQKEPAGSAFLMQGYSPIDRAVKAAEVLEKADAHMVADILETGADLTIRRLKSVQADTAGEGSGRSFSEDKNNRAAELITAQRKLQEARLCMIIEANYRLIKRGVELETTPIEKLVETLKDEEKAAYSALLGVDGQSGGEEKVQLLEEALQTIDQTKQVPAVTLGFADLRISTVVEIRDAGQSLKERFEKANQSYEALGTSPRADMGDSIKKAFGNVDAILEDLKLDCSPENERAVRILGYNKMDITPESITAVRAADEQMQRAFKALTPAVVAQMVKDGTNPLDMSMTELTEAAEKVRDSLGMAESPEERFSRFLVRLENNRQISQEEREAYIGIYRLIARVESGDDAALGSLLDQGREITMRNLMTAARTAKKLGSDVKVDDSFGELEKVSRTEKTITEQIELNLLQSQLKNAGYVLSPASLHNANKSADVMSMTPEELLRALEEQQSSEEALAERSAEKQQQAADFQKAVATEQEVYSILQRMEMPMTAENLRAVTYIMEERSQLMKDLLLGKDEKEEKPDIKALKAMVWEKFGEDIKTPEQMAKAQEALAEAAEHAMDGVMTREEVSSVDVRGMKLIKTATMAMRQMAQKQQTYHIPIMVGDEAGNVTLKIINGEKQQGLVDMLFSFGATGDISAHFEWKSEGVQGQVRAQNDETASIIAEGTDGLEAQLQEALGKEVDIRLEDGVMSPASLYLDEGTASNESTAKTSELYLLADTLLKFFKAVAAERTKLQ